MNPELQAFMKDGLKSDKVKDKYEVEIDESLNQYLEFLGDDSDPNENKLISKEMKKSKKKQEILNELLPSEVDEAIEKAFQILLNEGNQFLSKEDYEALVNALNEIEENLENKSGENPNDLSIQDYLKLTDKNIETIFNVAVGKSKESKFEDAFALFVLLSSVVPSDLDFLYRAGIAAQECGKINLAINYLSNFCELVPDFIDARLILIFCYIKNDLYDKAEIEFEIVNKLKSENEIIEAQTKAIQEIETLLKIHKKAA